MKSVILASLLVLAPAAPAAVDWKSVDGVFGSAGKVLPGDVHRYAWPRTDLEVKVGGVLVQPALALGSWGAFLPTGKGDETMAMGDLVLLEPEVTPVVTALETAGLEVTAIHNHLIGETPKVMYVHFSGHGEAAAMARGLKGALRKTGTPLGAAGKAAEPSVAEQEAFRKLQSALGRTGSMAGVVLQVGVPRAEKIDEGEMEIPSTMGMANSMNFQVVGEKVATTRDFVLLASEVNPVIRELRAHGIEVTAVHSHMLEEKPRLFFMHFGGLDGPEKIGEGLKAALSKVHTK